MCGLFGAVGQGFNPYIVRGLAVANRERGTDSLGMFDSSGRMAKTASDPMQGLSMERVDTFISTATRKAWFLAGHTRWATSGKVTRRNAHPFRYGRIIGSHNGCVAHPKNGGYSVDSQYLFDLLNREKQANPDSKTYYDCLSGVSGSYALSWFDGADFYLLAWGNPLAMAKVDGVWYYSSEGEHLEAILGRVEYGLLDDGEVLRWDMKKCNGTDDPETMTPFVSTASRFVWRDCSRSTNEWDGYWDDRARQWKPRDKSAKDSADSADRKNREERELERELKAIQCNRDPFYVKDEFDYDDWQAYTVREQE